MFANQIVLQLTKEPNVEAFARVVAAFVATALSGYFTGKIFLTLGFTSAKTKGLLTDIHDALGKSDLAAISTLAGAFPKNSPEEGLSKLASVGGIDQLQDLTKILKEADLIFQTVMHSLSLYLEALRTLVRFSLFFLCLWFIIYMRGIALDTSSQTNFSASAVAASLSQVMVGTAELLAVVAAIYFLERVCLLRILARRHRWELFLSPSIVWSASGKGEGG